MLSTAKSLVLRFERYSNMEVNFRFGC